MKPTSSVWRAGRLLRLARKELAEILRDRRTILTLVLMPLLLYPLMAVAFRQFIISGALGTEQPQYRIGFVSEDEQKSFVTYLGAGEDGLQRRGAFLDTKDHRPDAAPRPKLSMLIGPDLEGEVRRGEIDVGMKATPAGQFAIDFREELSIAVTLVYREDAAAGLDAARYVERLLREGNAQFLSRRLEARGQPQRAEPLKPEFIALPSPEGRRSQVFAVLLPLVLILMTITGAVYPAIDLTAGERERGTLEVLIAAPVPRWALLAGKYVAVVTVALMTALVNLGTMALTLWGSGVGKALLGEHELSLWFLPQILGLLLLLAAFFSALLLALTSFARSFKEAQAYLVPLMLASLMPGMVGFIPGLKLNGPLAVMPLVNIVLLARDLLEGMADAGAAMVVVLTTAIYAATALAVAAHTFGAEAVLYAQQGGWGEWLNRPTKSRPAASVAGAMLCVALLFPLSFVLNGVLAGSSANIGVALFLQALAPVLLFGALPLAAAWHANVRPISGFRLRLAGFLPCLGALMLGLTLWPLAHEIALLLRSIGIASLSKEQMDRLAGLIDKLRTAPLPAVVFVFGILTPICEELFFRGYLLAALLASTRPRFALMVSGLIFGGFHLIADAGLAVERLLPTTLLGLLLAWLCYRTGSLLPGILLHVAHNSSLLVLGLNDALLKSLNLSLEVDDHLPIGLLAGASAAALFGAWMVFITTRFSRRPPGDALVSNAPP